MGRNINAFFTNGDNITPQGSNVINLVGTLNSDRVEVEYTYDKYFPYQQSTASATWNIEHNLAKKPSVTLEGTTNSNGDDLPDMVGEVTYVDDNNIKITFSQAVAGWAYLN